MDKSYSPPKTSRRDLLAAGLGAFLFPQGRKQAALNGRYARAAHTSSKPNSAPAPIRFREIASSASLSFVLHNNPTQPKHLIETMPGGVAGREYEHGGVKDTLLTNGSG